MNIIRINKEKEERGLHDLFELGIVLKGIDGTLELAAGVLLWFLTPAALNGFVGGLFRGELAEDPKDWLAHVLLHTTRSLTAGLGAYVGTLLVAHGLVKMFLVAGLWRGKLWAYPAAIAAFAAFVAYELYQLNLSYSLFLWIVTIVDVLVIALIAHEYMHVRRHLGRVQARAKAPSEEIR